MAFIIKKISKIETWFLKEMLYEALFVPEGHPGFPRSILENPAISKYIENWGDDDLDVGFVAVQNDNLIGAIWGRRFSGQNRGYGFIDEKTPELSMAVKEDYRGKGIGTKLLNAVTAAYKNKEVKALSLSVDRRNPAMKLYQRSGFETICEEETSVTMKKQIS